MTTRQITTILCAGALGLGSALAASACGEDRGGVEVQGGSGTGTGTTGTSGATGTTGTTSTTTTTP